MLKQLQFRCKTCLTTETDLMRFHLDYNRIQETVSIGFWCIQCGNENEYILNEFDPQFELAKALSGETL